MRALTPDVIAEIKATGKELADAAPPLSTSQATLLINLFYRKTDGRGRQQ